MPNRNGDTQLSPCPLCGRPMIDGPSVDRHHWVPRSERGEDWSYLHRICHKKLHSLFSAEALARDYSPPAALLAHPDIQSFVKWVRKQPPELVGRHAKPKRKRA